MQEDGVDCKARAEFAEILIWDLSEREPGYIKQMMYDTGHWGSCDFPDLDDWDEQFLWRWRAIIKWLELVGDVT